MAKFAFVVPPLMGHVNPTLALGGELLHRGHQVAWISLDPSLESHLPFGGHLLTVRYDTPEDNRARQQDENGYYLKSIGQKNVQGAESIKFLFEDVLIPMNRYMYAGIDNILDTWQPDVLINDHQLFAGAIAACRKHIPYATSVTAPAALDTQWELPGVYEWEQKKIIALQQELGLEDRDSVACSDSAALVFTSREFFGDRPLPDHYRLVGPLIQKRPGTEAFPWEHFLRKGGHPRILVSIGTTFDHAYKKGFFQRVAEALGNQPLTVVVVSEQELLDHWPDNFIVQNRVPQLDLLPHLDAVVCHGGHNTVCESLLFGLPLVVIPIAYDQSHVASQVTRAGCGLRLNFRRFKPADLHTAVWSAILEEPYRQAATRIRDSFQKAGGASAAAAILENLSAKQN